MPGISKVGPLQGITFSPVRFFCVFPILSYLYFFKLINLAYTFKVENFQTYLNPRSLLWRGRFFSICQLYKSYENMHKKKNTYHVMIWGIKGSVLTLPVLDPVKVGHRVFSWYVPIRHSHRKINEPQMLFIYRICIYVTSIESSPFS